MCSVVTRVTPKNRRYGCNASERPLFFERICLNAFEGNYIPKVVRATFDGNYKPTLMRTTFDGNHRLVCVIHLMCHFQKSGLQKSPGGVTPVTLIFSGVTPVTFRPTGKRSGVVAALADPTGKLPGVVAASVDSTGEAVRRSVGIAKLAKAASEKPWAPGGGRAGGSREGRRTGGVHGGAGLGNVRGRRRGTRMVARPDARLRKRRSVQGEWGLDWGESGGEVANKRGGGVGIGREVGLARAEAVGRSKGGRRLGSLAERQINGETIQR